MSLYFMNLNRRSSMSKRQGASRSWTYTWAAIAIAAILFIVSKQAWVDSASINDPRAAPRMVATRGELFADEKSTINLFKQASPSVVHITAITVQRDFL